MDSVDSFVCAVRSEENTSLNSSRTDWIAGWWEVCWVDAATILGFSSSLVIRRWSAMSTANLWAARKSAPRIGKAVSATTKVHVYFFFANFMCNLIQPYIFNFWPLAVIIGGPSYGDRLSIFFFGFGTKLLQAPVSMRKFHPDSLSNILNEVAARVFPTEFARQ